MQKLQRAPGLGSPVLTASRWVAVSTGATPLGSPVLPAAGEAAQVTLALLWNPAGFPKTSEPLLGHYNPYVSVLSFDASGGDRGPVAESACSYSSGSRYSSFSIMAVQCWLYQCILRSSLYCTVFW